MTRVGCREVVFLAKKGICFLLVCLLFLVGCHGKSGWNAEQLFDHICSRIDIPRCEVYRYASDKSQNKLLSRLYSHGIGDIPPAVAFCDDYLICLYEGNEIWELHIFRTVSIYDNKRIQEMLVARRDMLQNSEHFSYYSDLTQKRVLTAEVFSYRNFVILSVTDQNESVRKALMEIK